jgi:lipopolysaccharide O-acetyltransferase
MIHGIRVRGGKRAKFRLTGSIKNGKNVFIGNDFFAGKDFRLHCQNGSTMKIGNDCAMMDRCYISAAGKVIIGDKVLMGSDVMIIDNNHGTNAADVRSYAKQPIKRSEVIIGNECWIGEKACILPGVHIGNRCIIGAGSVVTKDVPEYCMVAGNPAKVIKHWNKESETWERT